jgi:hypothetical protein
MMAMADYVAAIEYAAENAIRIICHERNTFQNLQQEIDRLTRHIQDEYQRAERAAMNAETPEDVAEAAGMHWDTYFGPDKERFHKDERSTILRERLAAIHDSLGALSGALLQFAKKGISLCHNGLGACPNGRAFGNQFLKDVVWQGRNQSLHWEAKTFHPAVQQCFQELLAEVDPIFADYTKRNMANEVVNLLSWKDLATFKVDMLSLT